MGRDQFGVGQRVTEIVVLLDMLPRHEFCQGGPLKRGVGYEVDNGFQTPNVWEREFVGVTEWVRRGPLSPRCVMSAVDSQVHGNSHGKQQGQF